VRRQCNAEFDQPKNVDSRAAPQTRRQYPDNARSTSVVISATFSRRAAGDVGGRCVHSHDRAASLASESSRLHDSQARTFDLIERLKPGIIHGQANETLEAQMRRLERAYNGPGKDSLERRALLLPGFRYSTFDADQSRYGASPE
jgi:hypothetical protein